MSTASMRREAEQDARLAALESRVLALESRGADRDHADSNLRRVLVSSTKGLPFSAVELLRHAAVDDDLRRALAAATIQTSGEVGSWLRDRQGTHDGIAITRLRRRRWRVTYTSDTLMCTAETGAY